MATPGDRDLATPIERAAPDFFTRDLDNAVRSGALDCAIHSAKDLPDPLADDLDWFWLPNRADPRDAFVTRASGRLPKKPVIGISSDRRRAWAAAAYPHSVRTAIRGAIDARLKQLVDGAFDGVVMAMAGIERLRAASPSDPIWKKITVTPIPVEELAPPEAQGVLAVVYRKGNAVLNAIRRRFTKAVRFVSAGTGDDGTLTLRGAEDLAAADVVLSDTLLGPGLARYTKGRVIDVGKRCGAHTLKQDAITRLLLDEVRKGHRVVRLKGGDAGLFGRLAEETDALTAHDLPFHVRAGVSALTVATTQTGLLLTRRGEARGFTAYTPRSTGGETTRVAFMSVRTVREECARAVAEGLAPSTPAALVFDAGGPRERIVRFTLAHPPRRAPSKDLPGLLVIGSAAAHAFPVQPRMLLTCSTDTMKRLRLKFEDDGWRVIEFPMIRLTALPGATDDVSSFDGIVLTSPAAVRVFFETYAGDVRDVPSVWTCGAGTDAALRAYGLRSAVMPKEDFSAAGLVAEIRRRNLKGKRFLRLRSAKAGGAVAAALRQAGARVIDRVLYANETVAHPEGVPPFDAVFFASASGAEAFLASYGAGELKGKEIYTMGKPTEAALRRKMK